MGFLFLRNICIPNIILPSHMLSFFMALNISTYTFWYMKEKNNWFTFVWNVPIHELRITNKHVKNKGREKSVAVYAENLNQVWQEGHVPLLWRYL